MNNLLKENYIAVHGLDNAMKVARTLIAQDYQVMVQLDDMDIYIVAFADNKADEYGSERFALITDEEEDEIRNSRDAANHAEAKRLIQNDIDEGVVDQYDFNWGDDRDSYNSDYNCDDDDYDADENDDDDENNDDELTF